jgi:hypothetical protein
MDQRQFRLVFFSVLLLTLLCGVGAVYIATASDNLSSAKQQILNSLLSLFMLGAGAIIGLIGSGFKPKGHHPKPQGSLDDDRSD